MLKLLSFSNPTDRGQDGLKLFMKMLEEASGGELIIKHMGSREVIPTFEQPEAVRTGIIDLNFHYTASHASMVPETRPMHLSELTPWEERESGFHDFIAERYKEAGFMYLGRAAWGTLFNLFMADKPVKNPKEDLKGLKFRSATIYEPIFTVTGAKGTAVQRSEIYTALERGLIDGSVWHALHVEDSSMWEVVKYSVGPRFWHASNTILFMNLAKWNSLPDHLKKLMLDVKEEAEPLIDKAVAKSYAESWEFIHDKERGIEHIEWSAADTKWFLTQIDEASWVDVSNHLGVDTTIKLRKLLSK